MIIEFFGPPGSGKSFYSSMVSSKLNIDQKYTAMRETAKAEIYSNIFCRLILQSEKITKKLRIYDSISYELCNRNSLLSNKLMKLHFATAAMYHSRLFDKGIYSLILRSLERDLVYSMYSITQKKSFINDDGILPRLVSIFGIRGVDWMSEKSEFFINTIISFISRDFKLVLVENDFDSFKAKIDGRVSLIDLELEQTPEVMFQTTNKFIDFLICKLEQNNISLEKIKRENSVEINLPVILKHIEK
jgi:hypothetical protein